MSSVSMVDGHIDPETGITIPEMTPQEALDLLNNVEFAEQYQGKDEYGTMLLMCKDALIKQIPEKPRTQFDRIKTMSIDEMVEFLEAACDSPCITICNNYDRCKRNNAIEPICKNHFKEWLESEGEDK